MLHHGGCCHQDSGGATSGATIMDTLQSLYPQQFCTLGQFPMMLPVTRAVQQTILSAAGSLLRQERRFWCCRRSAPLQSVPHKAKPCKNTRIISGDVTVALKYWCRSAFSLPSGASGGQQLRGLSMCWSVTPEALPLWETMPGLLLKVM